MGIGDTYLLYGYMHGIKTIIGIKASDPSIPTAHLHTVSQTEMPWVYREVAELGTL